MVYYIMYVYIYIYIYIYRVKPANNWAFPIVRILGLRIRKQTSYTPKHTPRTPPHNTRHDKNNTTNDHTKNQPPELNNDRRWPSG